MAMNGAEILLLVNVSTEETPDWKAVGEQTNLSRETTRNLIDASSKNVDHEKFIYGRLGERIELEALYVPDDTAMGALKSALENRQSVLVRRSQSADDATGVEEATAMIESINENWPDEDVATVSVSMRLNSEWEPLE